MINVKTNGGLSDENKSEFYKQLNILTKKLYGREVNLVEFFNKKLKKYGENIILGDQNIKYDLSKLLVNRINIGYNSEYQYKLISDEINEIDLKSAYINCGINNLLPAGKVFYDIEKKDVKKYLDYYLVELKNKNYYAKYGIKGDRENKRNLVSAKELSKIDKKEIMYCKYVYSIELIDCSEFFKQLEKIKECLIAKFPKAKSVIKTLVLACIGMFGGKKYPQRQNLHVLNYIGSDCCGKIAEKSKEIQDAGGIVYMNKTDCIYFSSKKPIKISDEYKIIKGKHLVYCNTSIYNLKNQLKSGGVQKFVGGIGIKTNDPRYIEVKNLSMRKYLVFLLRDKEKRDREVFAKNNALKRNMMFLKLNDAEKERYFKQLKRKNNRKPLFQCNFFNHYT